MFNSYYIFNSVELRIDLKYKIAQYESAYVYIHVDTIKSTLIRTAEAPVSR